jgi:hypothetical protein
MDLSLLFLCMGCAILLLAALSFLIMSFVNWMLSEHFYKITEAGWVLYIFAFVVSITFLVIAFYLK